MIEDVLIRRTIDELYPAATLEQRFGLRRVLVEILEDRRNVHCPDSRQSNPRNASMLAAFNRHYNKALRENVVKLEFV